MTDQTYNGWTNYETWLVFTWLGSEEMHWVNCCRLAQDYYDNTPADEIFTREERAVLHLCVFLRDEYENAACDWLDESGKSASIWADLLNSALSEVNWHEIASHLIQNVDENDNVGEAS